MAVARTSSPKTWPHSLKQVGGVKLTREAARDRVNAGVLVFRRTVSYWSEAGNHWVTSVLQVPVYIGRSRATREGPGHLSSISG